MNTSQHQAHAAWIFGGLLLAFFIGVFALGPESLPLYKQRLLAFLSALLGGFFAYFFVGSLQTTGELSGLKVKAGAGFGVFVLVLAWWLSPFAPVGVAEDLFRVRVIVQSPQGVPDDEGVKVWSSLGGEAKKVSGGWEFEIPGSKRPSDKKLTVYAEKATQFQKGEVEVALNQPVETVNLRLAKDRSGKVSGIVTDTSGHSLQGARVAVVGGSAAAVETDATGRFDLLPGVAVGEEVRLRVEKSGYVLGEQFHVAGDVPATVILEKN